MSDEITKIKQEQVIQSKDCYVCRDGIEDIELKNTRDGWFTLNDKSYIRFCPVCGNKLEPNK